MTPPNSNKIAVFILTFEFGAILYSVTFDRNRVQSPCFGDKVSTFGVDCEAQVSLRLLVINMSDYSDPISDGEKVSIYYIRKIGCVLLVPCLSVVPS